MSLAFREPGKALTQKISRQSAGGEDLSIIKSAK
jgi:hypothetical protein